MKTISKPLIFFLSLFIFINYSSAQSKYISASISNNTTGLPVIGYPALFYSQFHPGTELTYGRQINKSESNKLNLNVNVGFYYHQFVQSLVRIYPTIGYERVVTERLNLGIGLGAGYGLSFEGKNAFSLQDDGTYENKPFFGARSQYIIGLELGGTFALSNQNLDGPALLVQFKSFMQGTYVKSYVPLLPLNAINIGVRFPISNH